MESGDLKQLAERIAAALERIADAVERDRVCTAELAPRLNSLDAEPAEDLASSRVRETDAEEEVRPAGSAPAPAPVPPRNNEDVLREALAAKGIRVNRVPAEEASDDIINSLAEYLGSRYESLAKMLANIKRHMHRGGSFTLNLKEAPQQHISDICNFATRLHDIAFLEEYRYFRSPERLIRATTSPLPTAQNFFSGKWLERHILQTVQTAAESVSREAVERPEFCYMLNPQVTLPNGDDFELDLVFRFNGRLYWVEAKTGDYHGHIRKYSRLAKTLQLAPGRAIMVLPDVQANISADLTALFSMKVYNLSQFRSELMTTLRSDI